MRLSGLASGFDTDTMVQNLMKVERFKIDRYTQKRQVNLWRQESYSTVNKNMANFILNSKKNLGLSKTSSTGAIANQSFRSLDYVYKASSSNEDILGVSSRGKTNPGSFEVNVKELSRSASLTSKEISQEDLEGLKYLEFEIDLPGYGKQVLAIGDREGEKDLSLKDITQALSGKIKVNTGGEDPKEIEVDTGISAFYDRGTKRLFIQRQGTDMDLENPVDGGKFSLDLSLKDGPEELKDAINNGSKVDGALGSLSINGIDIYTKNNELEFNGLTLELKQISDKPVTITVETNADGIMDKIKGLVEEYNGMLDMLSEKLGEKRYSGYHPLSSEEKMGMHDSDVELWEEKAKSGMLNNDENINRMIANLRSDLYKDIEGLEGSFKNITQIGITTERYSRGSVGGRLQIDENKLRTAILDDPEGVMELLFSEKTEVDVSQDKTKANKGLFTGVYDNIIDGMKSIINTSGPGEDSDLLRNVRPNILIDFVTVKGSISDIDRDIRGLDRQIADMEAILIKKEDSYYERFTAMEKYMYEMNSQADWLTQQMMM